MAAVHDSAGVPFHALDEALRSLRPRGRCDELAARSATTWDGGAARSPAVGHRALSPPSRRLVPLNALRPGGVQRRYRVLRHILGTVSVKARRGCNRARV